MAAALGEKIAVQENGRRIAKLEAAAKQLGNHAAMGDQKAKRLALRLDAADDSRPAPKTSEGDKLVVAELVRRIRGSQP